VKIIVIGLGVQGHKRRDIAGADCVAIVDPYHDGADYKAVEEVPLADYDAALVCTPDGAKIEILRYLLNNAKHVLVEKPLLGDVAELSELAALARTSSVTCYTAYNHRFEPHFVRMKQLISGGALGQIYSVRMFYGNGTARLVRDSAWRDAGAGVLPDLGSHLLDTFNFWLGVPETEFSMINANAFENKAPDHCIFGSHGTVALEAEMTLLSWRNHFTADVFAQKGSAHIRSLCKWGPSSFTHRSRKLPSGRPNEETIILTEPDPTWQAEYDHFQNLCASGESNTENDIWIQRELAQLTCQTLEITATRNQAD
jgi:predicted dehydrogenase